MMSQEKNISGIVLVQDKISGGYTSFMKDYPEIIAEGDTDVDSIQHLFKLIEAVLIHDPVKYPNLIHANKINIVKEKTGSLTVNVQPKQSIKYVDVKLFRNEF